MLTLPISIAIAIIAPAEAQSPLQAHAEALANSPPEVQYEFITQIMPNYAATRARFIRLPRATQIQAALYAYYLAALKRATLVHRGDGDLVDLLNTFTGENAKSICLEFEQLYYSKFGSWPPIVPVDVAALTERMLSDMTVR